MLTRSLVAGLIVLMPALSASAANWPRLREINQYPQEAGSSTARFGSAVVARVDANNQIVALAVGAPYATVNGVSAAGAVHILLPSNGSFITAQTISAQSPQSGAHFGATLAVLDDALIVSAPDFDNPPNTDAGRVEIFRDHGSTSSPNYLYVTYLGGNMPTERLGRSLAADGTFVAVGAPGAVDGGGCVTLYQRITLDNFETVDAECQFTAGDAFGASVAIRQTDTNALILAVGSPGHAQNAQAAAGAGYVYVLVNGTLNLAGNLSADTPVLLDSFGTSIGISGTLIYVGATGRDKVAVGRTGSVTVFKPAPILGYTRLTEVFPGSGANAGDLCGAALSVDRTRLQFAMGCPSANGLVNDEGEARVFSAQPFITTPVFAESLLSLADFPHGADDMGRAVLLVSDRAYLGAPLDDVSTDTNHGSVQVFAPDSIFANGFEGSVE